MRERVSGGRARAIGRRSEAWWRTQSARWCMGADFHWSPDNPGSGLPTKRPANAVIPVPVRRIPTRVCRPIYTPVRDECSILGHARGDPYHHAVLVIKWSSTPIVIDDVAMVERGLITVDVRRRRDVLDDAPGRERAGAGQQREEHETRERGHALTVSRRCAAVYSAGYVASVLRAPAMYSQPARGTTVALLRYP